MHAKGRNVLRKRAALLYVNLIKILKINIKTIVFNTLFEEDAVKLRHVAESV